MPLTPRLPSTVADCLLLIALLAAAPRAQEVFRIADLAPAVVGRTQPSSVPEQFGVIPGAPAAILFTAELEGMGRELVRVRSTTDNESIDLIDLRPGPLGSDPKVIGDLPEGKVVFAKVGNVRYEFRLVPPDGPSQVIQAVNTFHRGITVSCGATMSDGLYCVIRYPGMPPDTDVLRIRATDVFAVADVNILIDRVAVRRLGNDLVIVGEHANGPGRVKTLVYRSDCTAAGTVLLREFEGPRLTADDDVPDAPEDRTVGTGGQVVSVVNTDQGPRYLVTDGTVAGTQLFTAVRRPGRGAAVNGAFLGRGEVDGPEGAEIVAIQGQQVTPVVVAPGTESADPDHFTAFQGNQVHFTATVGGRRGWRRLFWPSQFQQPVMDPNQFQGSAVLSASADRLYATVIQQSTGHEMVCNFNGTQINGVKLPGIGRDGYGGAQVNGSYYLGADIAGQGDYEPVRYHVASNTTAAVQLRPETDRTANSAPAHFVGSGGLTWFAAAAINASEHGLHAHDPRTGQVLTIPLNPTGGSDPRLVGGPDGRLYGGAFTAPSTQRAWLALRAAMVERSLSGVDPGDPLYLPRVALTRDLPQRGFAVPGIDPQAGRELLFFDVDDDSMSLLADLNPGPGDSNPHGLVARSSDGMVAFVADDGQTGAEPWALDPRTGTVLRLADVRPGAAGSAPEHLTFVGDTLFFLADDGVHGVELWCSDLTPQGTRLVLDLMPGAAAGAAAPLIAFAGQLAFQGTTPATGAELATSDGTPGGTQVVLDLMPGAAGSAPDGFAVAGGRLFFAAAAPAVGRELHCWTGSALRSLDLGPGAADSDPAELVPVGERVWFRATVAAQNGRGGPELWVSDGTAAGTFPLVELRPGPQGGTPQGLRLVDGRLWFAADDGVHGSEPYVVDQPGAVAWRVGATCGDHGATLDASTPLLGGNLVLSGANAPSGQLAALLLGVRTDPPQPLGFPPGCFRHLDLVLQSTLTAFVVTGPTFTHTMALPPLMELAGARGFAAQVLFLSLGGTFAVTASNGVALLLDIR